MSYVFFVILLCSIVPPGHFGVIQATTGEALVDEVIGNIKSSLDVREDHSLLKRIALVESRFGEDNDVIDANPEGGIWQITSDIHDVLNSTAEDKASSLLTSIENSFEFLCFLCSFNYSTPLRSGLAAQLFIEITNKFYISKTMCGQSKWWSENYHTSLDSSVFVERVTTYNVIPVEVNLDLMFLFDVSENVDQEKFERSKDFTCTLAAQFSISKTKTSCGAVEFAKSSQNSCPFKKTNDLNDFQSVLVNRTKPKVVKESGKAIEEILDRGYLTEVKPRSDGISARKCVVMMRCDGKETDDLAAPIDKMHAENVTVLTLGIGDDIEKEEIQFVNPGDNMYFPNFSDLLQEDNQKQIITEGITKAFCRHENPYTPGEMIVICITLCVVSVNEAEGEDRKAYYRLGSEIEFEIKCDWCTGFNVTKGGEVVGTENYTNSISARDFEIMVKLESFRNQLETDFNNGVPLSSSAASTCIDEPKGDVWFMLDGSGNITDEQFQATLDFVSAMASKLNVSNSTVRAGLSVASSDNHVIYNTFNDSSDLDTFQQLVTSAEKPPVTKNIGESLLNTLNEAFAEDSEGRNITEGDQNDTESNENVPEVDQSVSESEKNIRGIVIFVGGESSDDVSKALLELQEEQVSFIAVEIGNNVAENQTTQLNVAMAKNNYGRTYELESISDLDPTVIEELVVVIETQPISMVSSNPDYSIEVETNDVPEEVDGGYGETEVESINTADGPVNDEAKDSSNNANGNAPSDAEEKGGVFESGGENEVSVVTDSPQQQQASSSLDWLIPFFAAIIMLAFILFFLLYKKKKKRKRQIKPALSDVALGKHEKLNGEALLGNSKATHIEDRLDENEVKEDNDKQIESVEEEEVNSEEEESKDSEEEIENVDEEIENLEELYAGEENVQVKILEDLHVITDEAWLPTAGKPQLSRLEKQIDVAKINEIEDDQLQESCDVKDDLEGRLKALKELKEIVKEAKKRNADENVVEKLNSKLEEVESRRIPLEDLKDYYKVLKDLKKKIKITNDLKMTIEEAKKPCITLACMAKLEKQIELAKSLGVSSGNLKEPFRSLTLLKKRLKVLEDLKRLTESSENSYVNDEKVKEFEKMLKLSEDLEIPSLHLKESYDAFYKMKKRSEEFEKLKRVTDEALHSSTETVVMMKLKEQIMLAERLNLPKEQLKEAHEAMKLIKERIKAIEDLRLTMSAANNRHATWANLELLQKRIEAAKVLRLPDVDLAQPREAADLLTKRLQTFSELKELSNESKTQSDLPTRAEKLRQKLELAINLGLSPEQTKQAQDALNTLSKRISVMDDLEKATDEALKDVASEDELQTLERQLQAAEKLYVAPEKLCKALDALNALKNKLGSDRQSDNELRSAVAEAEDSYAGKFTLIRLEKQLKEAEGQNLPEDLMKQSYDVLNSLKERVKIVDELERLTIEATKTITPDCLKKLESQIQLAESHNISNDVLTVSYEAMERLQKQIRVMEELTKLSKEDDDAISSIEKTEKLHEKLTQAESLQIPPDMLKESRVVYGALMDNVCSIKEELKSASDDAKDVQYSNASTLESLRLKIKAARDIGMPEEELQDANDALKMLQERDDEINSTKAELQEAVTEGNNTKIKEALAKIKSIKDPLKWNNNRELAELINEAEEKTMMIEDEASDSEEDKKHTVMVEKVNSILEREDVEEEEIEELIAELEKKYEKTGDERYKILKEKAKRKLIDITRYKCILGLQRGIGFRNEKMLRDALDFVDHALETKLKGYDIEADEELSGLCDKAEDLLSLFTQLQKMKNVVMALKQPTISEVRSYNHPPPALRYVMEATYLLLGVEKKKLEVWKEIQSLIAKTGKEALKRRIWERNLEDISFKDALLAQTFIADYKEEDILVISKAASVFYSWSKCVIHEVINRSQQVHHHHHFHHHENHQKENN